MDIIFSKRTNNRKKEFQIETQIILDNNELFVLKKGAKHCLEMEKYNSWLKKYYPVANCRVFDDVARFEYVKGVSLETIMLEGDYKKALDALKVFTDKPLCDFEITENFIKYFGDINYQGKALEVSNIDLVFSNIILSDNGPVMIDYEWTVNFPVPRDFIIYRALKLFFEHHLNCSFTIDDCLDYLNVEKNVSFDSMIEHFSNLIEGEQDSKYYQEEKYIFNAIENSHKEIIRLNDHINELGSWGTKLSNEIEVNNVRINNLNEDVNFKNNQIGELLNKVSDLNNTIDNNKETIKRKEEVIEILNIKFEDSQRESNKYREKSEHFQRESNEYREKSEHFQRESNEYREKSEHFQRESNEYREKSEHFQRESNEYREKSEHFQRESNEYREKSEHFQRESNEYSTELDHIKRSGTYKLSLKYFKVRDFFFPANSKRKLFMKVFLKSLRHPIWFIKHLTPTNIKKFFKYSKSEGGQRVLERLDAYQQNNMDTSSFSKDLDLYNMLPREEYPVLELPKCKHPLVSIIIPVYNQFSYTYGCIESIIKNTKEIDYEVIIGDDCSTDETVNIAKYVKNIKVNKNKTNTRFLLNCNNASKIAKGQYIMFLNNDTNVQWNWLKSLIETIEEYPNAGMVGSKLVYPTGKLQEAGGILWRDGSAWNYGNKSDADASEYNYRKPVDYISGAAIMLSRKLWEEIGGFDTAFCPAYCEDSDLAFEIRRRGYEVVYDPFSVVVHYEGVSNGTDLTSGVKQYQVDNSKRLYEKWKDVLKNHYPNAENVFVARERSYNKKNILMIDHYVPQYDKDAGSRTVFGYLKLMCEMGYNVKFIGENFYRHEPYTKELQKLGVEVLYGPHYANNWKSWLDLNGHNFDYVFFNRPHITAKFIDDVVLRCPKAKIIYYGHDLHYVRIMREYELKKDSSLIKESEKWRKVEFELFDQADLVYYPSSLEIEEIKKEKPNLNAKVLQPYLFTKVNYNDYDPKSREGILFVGGFRHSPNFDGIMWFINDVFPSLLKEKPDLKLYIAGSYPPQELVDKASENIIVKGFVSDEELNNLYNSVRLVVVPLRYGAGIKGKVVEAMSNNVPVITTACGAEGILTDAIKIDETLKSVVEYYNDLKQLKIDSKKEYEYIMNEYTFDSAREKLYKDFEELK